MRAISVVVVTLVVSLLSAATASAGEKAESVSIVRLIATPEQYEGKLVSVRGFVHLEFEGNGIYLHKEDYEQSLTSNGLWLNAGECKGADGRPFETGYAWVIGRFTSKRRGHLGLWSGEIQDVQDCIGWPPHRAGT